MDLWSYIKSLCTFSGEQKTSLSNFPSIFLQFVTLLAFAFYFLGVALPLTIGGSSIKDTFFLCLEASKLTSNTFEFSSIESFLSVAPVLNF
jgi:hypothetical protein